MYGIKEHQKDEQRRNKSGKLNYKFIKDGTKAEQRQSIGRTKH